MNGARPPKKILIVDDDPDAAWALATMLRSELACEVRTAFGGAEAVDHASEMRPQAIVMDIMMPRVDGIEAVKVLRHLFAAREMPRLIALTGLTEREQRSRILASGFDSCLPKPLDFAALVEVLRGG